MILLHDEEGREFWVRRESIHAIKEAPKNVMHDTDGSVLWIWPCPEWVKEKPDEIRQLIVDDEEFEPREDS